jgi:RNA polymerase sigma-70 factor (ECF subfamily)
MKQKENNEEAQETITRRDLVNIYEEFSPLLFKYAVRLLGNAQLAEDCVSETFSRFLKVIQKGVGTMENLKGYLYKIAHNCIKDYYRRRVPESTDFDISLLSSPEKNPESKVNQKAEEQKVRDALLNLPEDQLNVIMLRFYEDFSHEETATVLGKSAEATRALQYRALKGLRGMLIQGQA